VSEITFPSSWPKVASVIDGASNEAGILGRFEQYLRADEVTDPQSLGLIAQFLSKGSVCDRLTAQCAASMLKEDVKLWEGLAKSARIGSLTRRYAQMKVHIIRKDLQMSS